MRAGVRSVRLVLATGVFVAACIIRPEPPPLPTQAMSPAASLPPYAAVVTLVPGERHQTLVGFGRSIVWYQRKLVPTPPDGAYEMLFPELGTDILRLRNRWGRVVKREDDPYYSMRHFARFTDPGDVRVGAKSDAPDKIRATAFLSPRGDRLTAIVINSGDQTADVRIDTSAGATAGGGDSAVYRTVYRPPRESETWKELGPLLPTGVIQLPGRSIATVVWSVAKKS